jgi:transposase-like protein
MRMLKALSRCGSSWREGEVGTRKVSAITESLCGTSISKSAVSRLIAQLDVRVAAFDERRLDVKMRF